VAQREEIRALVEPILHRAGLEVWDVEVLPGIIRVLADAAGGVDLDRLSAVSNPISRALDEHPELTPAGRYQLEVSSPGLERPLRTPEQFIRYVGSDITVKTTEPIGGSRRLRGRLACADDHAVRLESGGEEVEVRYDQIQKARTVLATTGAGFDREHVLHGEKGRR
jgi:ribosome maturation factor RimP